MGKLIDRVSVSVSESTANGVRRIVVEVEGKESLFATSDLLAAAGAMESLPQLLKSSVKSVVINYSEEGKAILQTLASTSKTKVAQPSRNSKTKFPTETNKESRNGST